MTSFWRGPYNILDKCSELNYRVHCVLKGKKQVVHVDRIRLRHPQLLRGESSQLDEVVEQEKSLKLTLIVRIIRLATKCPGRLWDNSVKVMSVRLVL